MPSGKRSHSSFGVLCSFSLTPNYLNVGEPGEGVRSIFSCSGVLCVLALVSNVFGRDPIIMENSRLAASYFLVCIFQAYFSIR